MIRSTLYHHMTPLVHRSWPCSLFTVASVHWCQVLLKLHRLVVLATKHWLALHHCNSPSNQALSWSSPPRSHDSMSCQVCNELLLIITCGLITYVSPYATLLVHLMLSLNYQNQTKTFHGLQIYGSSGVHWHHRAKSTRFYVPFNSSQENQRVSWASCLSELASCCLGRLTQTHLTWGWFW